MTEDELLEHLDCPEVEYKDDGTVWIYYHNQTLEITNNFNNDGSCYMLRKDNSKSMYITIKIIMIMLVVLLRMSSHGSLTPAIKEIRSKTGTVSQEAVPVE